MRTILFLLFAASLSAQSRFTIQADAPVTTGRLSLATWVTDTPTQYETDTVRVVLMVSDTSDAPPEWKPEPEPVLTQAGLFAIRISNNPSPFEKRMVFTVWGYSVREHKRNNSEVMPTIWTDSDGTMHTNYDKHWIHSHYLTADFKPIPDGWVIWQSADVK